MVIFVSKLWKINKTVSMQFNLRYFFYLFLTLQLVAACSSKEAKLKHEITKYENELKDSSYQFDKKRIEGLIKLYNEYTEKFPEDSLCAQFLLKAGDLSGSIGSSREAISFYDRILQQYPSFSKTPEVLFLKAFAYENQLHQYSKALVFYKDFIQKYPDHELTDDAEMAIKFMGKSPEEMVKYFEQQNDSIKNAHSAKK